MGLLDRFKKNQPDDVAADDSPEEQQAEEVEQESADGLANEPADELTSSEGKKGLWSRFRQGLKRTRAILGTDIRDLRKQLQNQGSLVDDAFLEQLFAVLVKTDMGGGPAGSICERIKSDFRGRVVQLEEVLQLIRSEIKNRLDQPEEPIQFASSGLTVIMVVGVNGSGKTTSIAKLTHLFQSQGKRVVLGAADTFRAAAVEQLTIWSERLGAGIVTGEPGGDPASVAHRAVAEALATEADVCIVDTAGRLQTQVNLMKELEKIRRVISNQVPEAPHETLLVLDATGGQNGLSQARGFTEAAGCTGIILAKLDGTAKGGIVIPIHDEFELPVKYIGQGEQPADLALFNADQFVDALFSTDDS